MYAVPYGLEGEQGNGTAAQGPGSPNIMAQLGGQLQSMSIGAGPVCVVVHDGGVAATGT